MHGVHCRHRQVYTFYFLHELGLACTGKDGAQLYEVEDGAQLCEGKDGAQSCKGEDVAQSHKGEDGAQCHEGGRTAHNDSWSALSQLSLRIVHVPWCTL